MKKIYSLKSVLLGAAMTLGSLTAFAQGTVDASLYEETFGDYGSSLTTFTASNMADYDKRGTTTLVSSDLASLTFAGANAMYSTATSGNTTSGNVWLNKSTTGYFEVNGIKTHNAKKVKVTFSQTGGGVINVFANNINVGNSTSAGTTNTISEFSVEANTTLSLKFQRTNTSTNLRIDNIKVIITEIDQVACANPTIVSQPVDVAVTAPASATFTVGATGENLTYEWQVSEGDAWIPLTEFDESATTASFTIPTTVLDMNAAIFRVVVSSGTCQTISDEVTLTVAAAACTNPIINTQPVDVDVTAPASATFTVGATGENLTYEWQLSNGNAWVPLTEFDESATTASFTIPTTALDMNAAIFRVVVSSGACQTISDEVTLTVSPTLAVGNVNTAKANLVKNTVVSDMVIFTAKADVQILNMNGQVVKTASVNENTSLNVASLEKGTYIVTGNVNGKAVSQKIIKK